MMSHCEVVERLFVQQAAAEMFSNFEKRHKKKVSIEAGFCP
jgi:hypothetical protein